MNRATHKLTSEEPLMAEEHHKLSSKAIMRDLDKPTLRYLNSPLCHSNLRNLEKNADIHKTKEIKVKNLIGLRFREMGCISLKYRNGFFYINSKEVTHNSKA